MRYHAFNPKMPAAYIRVSSEKQKTDGLGAEDQRATILRYCEFKRWPAPQFYEDTESGASADNREQFQAMVSAVQDKLHDVIICREQSRLGRNAREVMGYVYDEIRPYGCEVVVTDLGIDTSTLGGRMLLNQMAVYSEFERELITNRTHGGKRQAMLTNGTYWGGQPPYGYKRSGNGIAIDEREAAIVKRIFAMVAANTTYRLIAATLNSEGVVTRGAHTGATPGAQWSSVQISRIVKNLEIYQGLAAHGDDEAPVTHEAIMPVAAEAS